MTQRLLLEGGASVECPEGPKCRKCGHEPCAFCRDSCDTIVDGEFCSCIDDGSGCDFEPSALEAWLRQVDELQGREYEPPKPAETEEECVLRKQREEISSRMRWGQWVRNSDGKTLTTVDEVLEAMRSEGSAFFKSRIAP